MPAVKRVVDMAVAWAEAVATTRASVKEPTHIVPQVLAIASRRAVRFEKERGGIDPGKKRRQGIRPCPAFLPKRVASVFFCPLWLMRRSSGSALPANERHLMAVNQRPQAAV
jgi:hypothetical protein